MAKKESSKIDFGYDAFHEFVSNISKESDRAAVILGVARLDNLLREILVNVLAPSVNDRDELLDDDRPLSTFSARINLAFRLGLIGNDLTKSLKLLQRIRNVFAHQEQQVSLENGPAFDWAREVISPFRQYTEFDRWVVSLNNGKPTFSQCFRGALALITLRLQGGV